MSMYGAKKESPFNLSASRCSARVTLGFARKNSSCMMRFPNSDFSAVSVESITFDGTDKTLVDSFCK